MYKSVSVFLFWQAKQANFFITLALALCLQLTLPLFAHADADSLWSARLTPNPISFGTRDTLIGIGAATAELQGNTLTIDGWFKGLRGTATAVKIHRGPKAIPGPAIHDLNLQVNGDGKQGALQGEVILTEQQRQALLEESLYIQLYSDVAEEGNLRGWLLPVSEDG